MFDASSELRIDQLGQHQLGNQHAWNPPQTGEVSVFLILRHQQKLVLESIFNDLLVTGAFQLHVLNREHLPAQCLKILFQTGVHLVQKNPQMTHFQGSNLDVLGI